MAYRGLYFLFAISVASILQVFLFYDIKHSETDSELRKTRTFKSQCYYFLLNCCLLNN